MSRTIICQVCGRALDNYISEDGARYIHSPAKNADHEPVPVAAPEGWRGECDFCAEHRPEYVLPARDFSLSTLPGLEFDQSSRGDWAACPGCAELIERNQWNRLEQRVAEAMHRKHGIPTDGPHRDQTPRRLTRRTRHGGPGNLFTARTSCRHDVDSRRRCVSR